MILHRLEVENFGCFTAPVAVEFAASGLTLLTGPNGAGKSTLLGALQAAFIYSYKSGATEVAAWQNWGRATAPRVAVEFTHGGLRFLLEKRYLLKGRMARLAEWRDGIWVTVAEDEAAEARLPEFLGGEASAGRGAASKQPLLASVLWVAQNSLTLSGLDAPVLERIRTSLGAQTATSHDAAVAREVDRLYQTDWTPMGRRKKGSPAAAAEEGLEAAKAECASQQAALEALDRLRERCAQCAQEAEVRAAMAREAEASAASMAAGAERIAELKRRRQSMELELKNTQSGYQLLHARLDRRRRLERQRQELCEETEAFAESRARAAAAVEAAEAGLYLRLRKAQTMQHELQELEAELRLLAAPPQPLLQRIERLETRLDAALLHVTIKPEPGSGLVLERDGQSLPLTGMLRLSGSPDVVFRIPGVAEFRASGPGESADLLAAELARAREEMRAPDRAVPLVELMRRRLTADGMEFRLRKGLDEMRLELQGDRPEQLAELEQSHPAWHESLPSPPPAGTAPLEVARERLRLLGNQQETAAQRMKILDEELSAARQEVADIALLQAELETLAFAGHGQRAALDALDAELAACPAGLEESLRQARADARRWQELSAAARRDLQQAETELALRLREAPYASYAEACERVATLAEEFASLDLRASSSRLLRETLLEVEREQRERFAEPVTLAANELLGHITGGAPGALLLDGSLGPAGVVPEGGGRVGVDRLSGGEQEQVHFATRLALADLLAREEPQLVVFDDVLMATDAVRLDRVLRLLESRRGRLQAVLLTCHPERYTALENCPRVDVGALRVHHA